MQLSEDSLAKLDHTLASGALVLVPNYRTSDQLIDQLCTKTSHFDKNLALPRPSILAIDLWFRDLWHQLAQLDTTPVFARQLLQPAEEQQLWRELISSQAPDLLLLNQEGTAKSVASAYRLLQQWQVSLDELRQHLDLTPPLHELDDRARAYTWFVAFTDYCNESALLTFSGMLQALQEQISQGSELIRRLVPDTIVLWGFDSPPPLYIAIFDALKTLGLTIDITPSASHQPSTRLYSYNDIEAECVAAARWAATILKQDPAASIGIITTDSDTLKGALTRSFRRQFHARPEMFTNTLSASLADSPWVNTALQLFMLTRTSITTTDLLLLLKSPWLLGSDSEADARAELENRIRRTQSDQTRVADLRFLCLQQDKPWYCPMLGEALLQLEQNWKRQPATQDLSTWLNFFSSGWNTLLPRELLLAAGQRSLLQAWEGLLRQLYNLNHRFTSQSAAQTQSLIKSFCRNTTLALGKQQAPVLLLTPVTAAGLHFSHLWSLQMTDAQWPGDQRPHPYLPLKLQQTHGMPASSAPVILEQSKLLFASLMQRTQSEVVLSYARVSDDLPQRVTALLAFVPDPDHMPVNPGAALHPLISQFSPVPLEVCNEATSIPLRQTAFSGGTTLITSQSACPFKAFAQFRLKLREQQRIEYGIPASAIGNCIHDALQSFWNQLKSQAQLNQASPTTLQSILVEALTPALNRIARDYPHLCTPQYRSLEQTRLSKLLMNWLEFEKQRAPFVLFASELDLQLTLSGLSLNVRLDRVDIQEDGSAVIIDYKTGRQISQRWEDERPEAPQLMLYQLAWQQQADAAPSQALLYAQINVEALGYRGVGESDATYPGIAFKGSEAGVSQWQELGQLWTTILTRLADEFLQGYAAVRPTRAASCAYCQFGPLCRVDARRLNGDAL